MNSNQNKQQLTSKCKRSSSPWYCRRPFVAAVALSAVGLVQTAFGQTTINANFDMGNDLGFTHYAPLQTAPWNEQVTWTFPSDPARGFSYHIFGGPPDVPVDPAQGNNTGPAR